jgi:transposase InsO family protein
MIDQVQGNIRFQSGGRGIAGHLRGPCWNCGVPGHSRAQCTKRWPQAESQANVREKGQARDSSGEGHASFAATKQVQAPGEDDKAPRDSQSLSGETASAPQYWRESTWTQSVSCHMLTLVDGFTKYVEVKAVHAKSDVPRVVKETLSQWETQSRCKVKRVRTDRGTEFVKQDLKQFFADKGIVHETSAPYTPEHYGTA